MAQQAVDKYRQAGLIAQNALSLVIAQLHNGIGEQTIGEVCRAGDKYIQHETSHCFKSVKEKGIAKPVEISKNDFVSGISPEKLDTFQAGIVNDGDVLKISLGVHIDGYTVIAGHTVIVREGSVAEPATGPAANAVIGSFLATEAVVAMLSGVLSENHPLHSLNINGATIRVVVEGIARSFGLIVVPGSRVRRIKRFVSGQPAVKDSLPEVEWRLRSEEDESKLIAELDAEFVPTPGHSYLVEIAMAPGIDGVPGYIKLVDVQNVGSAVEGPSVYSRDHTVTYQLRTAAARHLLGTIDNELSVYPFKLSYLTKDNMSMNQLKLGLNECIQRHLLVGEPRLRAMFVPDARAKDAVSVPVAKEIATVSLIPAADSTSGYPELLRFSGGRAFPPSWTHSEYSLGPGLAADVLNARLAEHKGVRYVEVHPSKAARDAGFSSVFEEAEEDEERDAPTSEVVAQSEMEIEI